ncbi:hypothetical protein Salat_0079500 [Sesamum alatum]|uniref:PAR1 protein n=1 Tax=Sesamum alatum TaxID=300844 RepID=A0AAE1YWA8_9LAMI|nr:hypothetical protein Salat_0079500 [Sesamum alatum]
MCALENHKNEQGKTSYMCKTSEVLVEKLSGYIETKQCVNACGLQREGVEISFDTFLSSKFTAHLCSSACYHNCPNIVDLLLNLTADEGVSLPNICKNHKEIYRTMYKILSSDSPAAAPLVAPAPTSF